MIGSILLALLSVVSTVAFSPPGGAHREPFIARLTLTVPESHMRIIYTTDGLAPVVRDNCKAVRGLAVMPGFNLLVNQSMTVTALACRPGATIATGLISSADYVVINPMSSPKRMP